MSISLANIGKRYNREWIFRNVNYEFSDGNAYVIIGSNGSGKSTLLQLIAGNLLASEGTISYSENEKIILEEKIFSQISFASPYLELLEKYTLSEMIDFHFKFKKYFSGWDLEKVIESTQLAYAKDKILKNYSSGMKQRVKLALAILSDTPFLLLDEPASNLDKNAIEWYQNLIKNHTKNRIVIVCSNEQKHEYNFCNQELKIEDYK
ncbi:MAG: ATP-binding cassette domain-containing protein [Bacteroidia bacterium]